MRFHPNRIPSRLYWFSALTAAVLLSLYLYFFKTIPAITTIEKLNVRLDNLQDSTQFYRLSTEAYHRLFLENYDEALYLAFKADSILPGMQVSPFMHQILRQLQNQNGRIDSLRLKSILLSKEVQYQKSGKDEARKSNQVQADIIDMIQNQALILDSQYQSETKKTADLLAEIEFLKKRHQVLQFLNNAGKKVSYFGEVASGKADGYGIGIFEGKSTYQGEWKNNLRHGKGIYIWANGDSYEGEYKEDKRNGKGTYQFESGEKYVGDWNNDLREGRGALYAADGSLIVDGPWLNDRYKKKDDTLSR